MMLLAVLWREWSHAVLRIARLLDYFVRGGRGSMAERLISVVPVARLSLQLLPLHA
jgi:hypothetical protein